MLLSFVVPVYNVEQYILECLDSIYNQKLNLDDFEVVCIDDCGFDNSIKLIENYILVNNLKNCKILHHEKNKGLSGSRNSGASYSNGDYIMFVDSDDKIVENSMISVMEILRKNIYDIIEYNCLEFSDENVFYYKSSKKNITTFECDNGDKYLAEKIMLGEYYPMAVTKVVKKEIFIKSGKFTEGIIFEDEDYTPRLYLASKKCITLNDYIYYYRRRENSITSSAFNNDKWISSYVYIISRLMLLAEQEAAVVSKNYIYDRACNLIMSIIKNCAYYGVEKKIYVKAKQTIKEYKLNKYVCKSNDVLIRFQGYLMSCLNLYYHLFGLYYKFLKCKI